MVAPAAAIDSGACVQRTSTLSHRYRPEPIQSPPDSHELPSEPIEGAKGDKRPRQPYRCNRLV